MNGRLLRGIGANIYGQGVTVAVQLASVPGFLHAWGSERYGLWLMLAAVPTVLSFADGGFVVATATEMTVAVGRGETRRAGQLFAQTFRLVGAITGLCALLAMTTVAMLPTAWLPTTELRIALLCLAGVVLIGLSTSTISAGFRANGQYAQGLIATDTMRLVEAAAVLFVALSGGGIGAAASTWLVFRAFGVAAMAMALIRHVPWVSLRCPDAGWRAMRPLVRPAIAVLAIPAAFAISLQGTVIAVGAVLPLSAVAVLTAARTLTRSTVQACGLVTHAVMPEMSMALGRQDRTAMAALARLNSRTSVLILVPAWVVMVACGPAIVARWTAGRLTVDPAVLTLLATAALVHGLWLAQANLLLAANRQADYAYHFLGAAVLTCGGVAIGASFFGLRGVGFAVLVGEVAMAWRLAILTRRREGFSPDAPSQDGRETRPSVAVLIACHNRRAKTLACLASVSRQDAEVRTRVILFDDASTDGTPEAVRAAYPDADILHGDGQAFWSGGMRTAFDHALARDHAFYLWLNDDVILAPDALRRLLDTHRTIGGEERRLCLIGGAVADPRTERTSYGGVIRPNAWMPLRFARCGPDPLHPQACDTLVGNVVLVPRATARRIGSIGAPFRHTLGDLDYGLRVKAAGGWVGLAPGHVGWCEANERPERWFNAALPLPARWRLLAHPLGFPLRPWMHFAWVHGGPFWFVFAPQPFWRLIVPPALAGRIDSLRKAGRRAHAL